MIVKCCEKRSGLDSEPDESEPFEKFVERGGYMKVLDGEEAEKFSTKQPDTPVYDWQKRKGMEATADQT